LGRGDPRRSARAGQTSDRRTKLDQDDPCSSPSDRARRSVTKHLSTAAVAKQLASSRVSAAERACGCLDRPSDSCRVTHGTQQEGYLVPGICMLPDALGRQTERLTYADTSRYHMTALSPARQRRAARQARRRTQSRRPLPSLNSSPREARAGQNRVRSRRSFYTDTDGEVARFFFLHGPGGSREPGYMAWHDLGGRGPRRSLLCWTVSQSGG